MKVKRPTIRQIIFLLLCVSFFSQAWSAGSAVFDITRYGARGDGKTPATMAFRKAIDDCSRAGGGTVLIPAGHFVTGTIFLKSHVELHLEPGAFIEGSKNLEDYPLTISKIRSYTDNYTDKCLIFGEDLEDVAITGQGTIDGNGDSFEQNGPYKVRPYLIRIINCSLVRIRDVKMVDSPMWVQHYLSCDDVSITGITVRSRVNSNNDGIDIDACSNVRISDCNIISGDDAIVLKSTLDRPCTNVTVTNCVLSSRCNAIKLGTETNGGFQNITISNCTIYETGLAGITLQMVDGGSLERVTVTDINMDKVGAAIFIRLGNRARPYQENMEKPGPGKLSGVIISNIQGSNIGKAGCSITGLPGQRPAGIILSNICLSFEGGGKGELAEKLVPELPEEYPEHYMFGDLPAYGFYCRHCSNIRFDNVDLGFSSPDERPAIVCDDVENMEIVGLRAECLAPRPIVVRSSSVFLDKELVAEASAGKEGNFVKCSPVYTDDRELRISTPAGARAMRTEIIRAVWGTDKLPLRSDVIVTKDVKGPLGKHSRIARTDRFEIPVSAPAEAGASPQADLAYLFTPVKRAGRLVIINPGHTCSLRNDSEHKYGIEDAIDGLTEAGFDVLAVFMPHVSESSCDLDHCKVMNTPTGEGEHKAAYGLRFFLEPELVSLNYLLQNNSYSDISMVGLSGGGWTTNLLAAIDERISFSFNVAGSVPLYYRSAGSIGDVEQFLPEFYRAMAGYPDIYVLDALGKGRKHIQILNRNDDCCFGQRQHDPDRSYDNDMRTFEKSVSDRLSLLGATGHYYLVIDETAPDHRISEFTLKNVILKELKKPGNK